jgi:ring-1,2-phenylacetyl-CoA epoxidase subunit PaaC
LEEDIALANIALDLIGHAQALLNLAGATEAAQRDADSLAYHREVIDFRNSLLVEQTNGDFGYTITRHFLFSVFSYLQWNALSQSTHAELAGIAAKAKKETRYHCTHATEWMLRLGDGTAESNARAQNALDSAWPFVDDLFYTDALDQQLISAGIISDMQALKAEWLRNVSEVVTEAKLKLPESSVFMHIGGRRGAHSEHLGHLLATMQIVPRSYPGAQW